MKIPVEVSARHIHLSKLDLERLFGAGYQLKKLKQLGQPSDFAAEETVDIKINNKVLKNIRIVGPEREATQVEISKTDAVYLGIEAPVKLSGDILGTPGATLVGPNGEAEIPHGVIIARRHIHCATDEAEKLGLKNGQSVSVEIKSERPVIFEDVIVRVADSYKLCMHIDTDEGNAAGINRSGEGEIIL